MRILMNHCEKFACAIILVLCGIWMADSVRRYQFDDDPEWLAELIDKARGPETLPADFPYQPRYLQPYSERATARITSAERQLACVLPARQFYPQPARPIVMKPTPDPGPKWVKVKLPALSGLSAKSAQGKVSVCCAPPQLELEYFIPVCIELQRGLAPEKINRIVHRFDVRPAEARAETVAEAAVTRRAARKTVRNTTPKQVKSFCFEDTEVGPQLMYCYRARLIARFVAPDPIKIQLKYGADAKVVVDASVERLPEGTEGTYLYAGPWSSVVQSTVPTNTQLRFNFVMGERPDDPSLPQAGYRAFFGIRLWDADAQAWGEASLAVPVGSAIKGELKFKTGTATRVRPFDTGLVLSAVRDASRIRTVAQTEWVTGQGQTRTLVAGADGKFQLTQRQIVNRIPTQVAILKSTNSNREVRLVKGLGYEEKLPSGVTLVLRGEAKPVVKKPSAKAPSTSNGRIWSSGHFKN